MMHRAWCSIVDVPYSFSRSYVKFQGHTALKTRWIWPKLGVSGQQLHFEFTDGYEMLHKAWNSKGEVPYCFPRSSIKFQGHTGQNITDFDPNWAFPDNRPVAAFKSLRFALFVICQDSVGARRRPIYPATSIPWLLMSCCLEPGQQQPWYSPSSG